LTNKQYDKIVKGRSPASPLLPNMLKAFVVGGAICTIGQLIQALFMYYQLDKESAGSATSITLIFLGAFLTGFGIYDKMAKFAGAGTLVPITGFANSVVSPAMEFKTEGLVMGLAAKMFIIAGPIIVFGTLSSVIYGVLLVLLT